MIHQFSAKGTNAKLNFEINLVPDKQVYCFIGENACGKTNLMENMARTALFFHSLFSEDTFLGKEKPDIGFVGAGLKIPDDFTWNGNIDKDLEERYKNNKKVSFLTFSIERKTLQNSNLFTINQPVIFISAHSRGYLENTEGNKKQKTKSETFTDFFKNLINNIHGVKNTTQSALADWIFERLIVNTAFTDNTESREHEVRLIVELLEALEPEKFKGISKEPLTTIFKFNNATLSINGTPVDKLSTGYVSILKIFQEIIAGYGAWLGLKEDKDIRNANGLVFIDEIESHLHAKWQYEIIPLLKRFFPKTTFYIATHSPLIISTTKKDEAYELLRDENEVKSKNLGNPSNWYWNSLLSQAFHVPLEKKYENVDISLQLHTFSDKVKEYKKNSKSELKKEILSLYDNLLPNFSEDDPRLKTIETLKSMVA